MKTLRLIRLVAACFLLFTAVARAEPTVHTRTMGFVVHGNVPHLYYSASDLLTAEGRKKLDSGLPQRIVVEHFVYSTTDEEPIAVAGHSCRIVYDLWQMVYRVEHEVFGAGIHSYAYKTQAEVVERCLVMRRVPLGLPASYRGKRRIYVASLVEFNPLSSGTLARIRRWLSRSQGDYSNESKAFFGSFVSLFVNDRIGSADRVLRLRSQVFELPRWR